MDSSQVYEGILSKRRAPLLGRENAAKRKNKKGRWEFQNPYFPREVSRKPEGGVPKSLPPLGPAYDEVNWAS